jgi:hypothetical protein
MNNGSDSHNNILVYEGAILFENLFKNNILADQILPALAARSSQSLSQMSKLCIFYAISHLPLHLPLHLLHQPPSASRLLLGSQTACPFLKLCGLD